MNDRALNYLFPDRQEQHDRENRNHSIGAYLTSAVPPVVASPMQQILMHQVMEADRLPLRTTAGGELRNPILRQLKENSGLDVGVLKARDVGTMGSQENAAYVSKPNWLNRKMLEISPEEAAKWRPHGMIAPINPSGAGASMSPEIFAHEIGHGMAHHSDKWFPKLVARSRTGVGLAGKGLGGIDFLRALWGDKDLKEREHLLNQSSLATGAGFVPTLINESHASQNAMKLLRSLPEGVAEKYVASGAKMLPRAYGTYGLGALAGVLAPQMAKWWYQSHPNTR